MQISAFITIFSNQHEKGATQKIIMREKGQNSNKHFAFPSFNLTEPITDIYMYRHVPSFDKIDLSSANALNLNKTNILP